MSVLYFCTQTPVQHTTAINQRWMNALWRMAVCGMEMDHSGVELTVILLWALSKRLTVDFSHQDLTACMLLKARWIARMACLRPCGQSKQFAQM